jgi:hypothetical protein
MIGSHTLSRNPSEGGSAPVHLNEGRDGTLVDQPGHPSPESRETAAITEAGGVVASLGCDRDVAHIRFVFVHGIGSQLRAQTLREWSVPMARALRDRLRLGDQPFEPVIATNLDPDSDLEPFVEFEVPVKGGIVHWVFAEAWWANRIVAPSFQDMARWLWTEGAVARLITTARFNPGPRLPRRSASSPPTPLVPFWRWLAGTYFFLVGLGIRGYLPFALGAGSVAARAVGFLTRSTWREPAPGETLARYRALLTENAEKMASDPSAKPPEPFTQLIRDGHIGAVIIFYMVRDVAIEASPAPWTGLASGPGSTATNLIISAVAGIVLLSYGAIRAVTRLIPIDSLRNAAVISAIDGFVLDWFGDVEVLIKDRVQSTSVCERFLDVLGAIQPRQPTDKVIVLAHSGGTVVTHLALSVANGPGAKVDSFIMHGEALNLVWDLVPDLEYVIGRIPAEKRGAMAWHDFWATHDPAPAGQLDPPYEVSPPSNHVVTNRGSVDADHGAYWENDEEFVFPLLKHIDGLSGVESSRFDTDDGAVGARRQRVSLLRLWNRVVIVGPIVAIFLAMGLPGKIGDLGDLVAAAFARLPGTDLVVVPIKGIQASATEASGLLAPLFPIYRNIGWLALELGIILLAFRSTDTVRSWADWPSSIRRALGTLDVFLSAAAWTAVIVVGVYLWTSETFRWHRG